jgi:enamine deaminase RidA (YjgF/YER057c/UK114 family)
MSNLDDFPAFNEVWSKYFPKDPPVTSLIQTAKPGFGLSDATIEINVLALADEGKTKKEVINLDIFTGYPNQSLAIRAGDLLFISGLMAIEKNGLISKAKVDPCQPYFISSIQDQMDYILQNAQNICLAAGTSLENLVRIQQFHTELAEFYPAYQVWQQYLSKRYLPFSAIQVPAPMPVPGCTVMLDLWVYAP